ncbi:MAG: ribokinase [Betaproteobacteria bacterium]
MVKRLLVVGSLNTDLAAQTSRLPKPGETVMAAGFRTGPGGKGANQAVAAARLSSEVRVCMVGRVGDDPYGAALLANLSQSGVSVDWVGRDPEVGTGVALITVDESGQNTIVVHPGANARLEARHVVEALQNLDGVGALLIQLEIPLPTVEATVREARRKGVPVILNPAPAQPLSPELLSAVDFLVPNESEAELLSGVPIDGHPGRAERAARSLIAQGASAVLITLGAQGAILVDRERTAAFPAYAVKAVDATAAGDAFLAGFAVRLLERGSVEEAVDWGCRAGALAASRPGAQQSLPMRQEVERLGAEKR